MAISAETPEKKRIVLTQEYWQHIKFRHPEVGNDPNALMEVVRRPDEIHIDARGGMHALKRLDAGHFTVVIYEIDKDVGFIRTAYVTSNKRKSRRYRSQ
ncbi:MAG: hypothetical protein JRN20_02465 [Nitrososphaerota archaeon]|nr:hypothetical protein [Nitrososphaerota archaeon]